LPSTANGATWQEVLQSLQGKKVGVQTPVGTGLQLILASALDNSGVKDVTYVNVGGSNATTGPALDNGSVDAAIASPPGTQFLTESGKQKVLAYLPNGPTQYKEWYGSGWGAPASWLKANPKAAAGFCAAYQKGLDYIKDPAHAAEAEKALMADTGVPANIAKLVLASTYGAYSSALPEDSIEATLKGYVDAGVLKSNPPVTYASLVDDMSGQ
jgi:ABC-type nitrate/sulfonate/bicarbonate transport system substrate-binding protein